MSQRWLYPLAIVTSVATFILLLAGGLVTGTGSGLSVPDWPLSFGRFFPPMAGGVLYEHSHRLIAGATALLTFLLAIGLWRSEAEPLVKRLAAAAVLAVLIQAVLGGVTVLLKLPPVVSVAHATLAQGFFSLMVCLAVLIRETSHGSEAPVRSPVARTLRRLALATTLVILFQLAAGAVYRHTGQAFRWHLAGAVLVTLAVAAVSFPVIALAQQDKALMWTARWMRMLLALQVVLGYFSWTRGSLVLTTSHLGAGALLLASSAVFLMQAFRREQE